MQAAPVIFITGKDGQVGHALMSQLGRLGTVVAVGRSECDLSDRSAIARVVLAARPDIIVNAAAYTAVDKAESDSEKAFAVNAEAPSALAMIAKELNSVLIHYSTEYVFDGRKPALYREDDPTHPLSVYGRSKRHGEIAIQERLPQSVILRTSWVYGTHGNNFLKTMLRLAREREKLAVVADQVGAPTSAELIAQATRQIVRAILRDGARAPYGIYHLAAAGETSWHGYATFAIEKARKLGVPLRVAANAIEAITAMAYPTPAPRPANSRLDTAKLRTSFQIDLPPWQDGVSEVVEALARQ